jgi:CheY-like chemotaxis protein
MGAFTYLRKPVEREDLVSSVLRIKTFVDRQKKTLLIVEDAATERASLVELLSGEDVVIREAATGAEAVEILKTQPVDCMLLDLRLPDTGGIDLIRKIKDEIGLLQLPIIVHTGKDLSEEEEEQLGKVTSAVVIKDAHSPDRLLQEASLFLHRAASGFESSKQRMLETGSMKDPLLQGKTVLIVDDDMRNIYALTTVLEDIDMKVLHAQNGKRAIEALQHTPGIDIVLMDIMMPEMDGYQASREIRKMENFRDLPIIALTAKAMKGDRERCIESGASDYIPKPVDTERLLSLLRVWLYQDK